MNATPFELVILSLGIVTAIASGYAFWQVNRLKKLRQCLLKNGAQDSIEEVLGKFGNKLQALETEQVSTQKELRLTQELLQHAFQKSSLVKFNSLSNDGGNFSFALALLDFKNNGIIITNMYGRNLNRWYIKAISGGASDLPLTTEEEQALNEAITKFKN